MKNRALFLTCLLSLGSALASTDEQLEEGEEQFAESMQGTNVFDIACTGRQVALYKPGLTLEPREVTISSSATLKACVSSTYPRITSGKYEPRSGTSVRNCLLSESSKSTRTVIWNTGETSTFSMDVSLNNKPNGTSVIIGIGTVTDGLFKGSRIEQTVVLPNTTFDACLTKEGMTEAAGAVTFVIIPLS